MTGDDILKIGLTIVGGFVAYKVYKGVSSAIAAGGKVVDAVTDTAVHVVTKDLNPASTENIVYKTAGVVAGGGQSIGSRIYEWVNPDPMQAMADADKARLATKNAPVNTAILDSNDARARVAPSKPKVPPASPADYFTAALYATGS